MGRHGRFPPGLLHCLSIIPFPKVENEILREHLMQTVNVKLRFRFS